VKNVLNPFLQEYVSDLDLKVNLNDYSYGATQSFNVENSRFLPSCFIQSQEKFLFLSAEEVTFT
jgi:hypothetical protein